LKNKNKNFRIKQLQSVLGTLETDITRLEKMHKEYQNKVLEEIKEEEEERK